ncbi:MAG TPA: glycoside hydrolase family 1 protein [Candidatus Wildermuthbacteria bacterium]|nr:glycoside hydrolase family 1 protein [Candidatus Wildermuthbacteria bacterium]
MPKVLSFPKGFLWGSATSAFQVEGGIENADWSQFAPAKDAADQYRLFEKDFQLLSQLSQSAYRFSIEWSRVEPKEGVFDEREIAHYRKVLKSLREKNITSMVTLHHFTTPLWLADKGGWANGKSVEHFTAFAERMAKEYGDLVDLWVTINEPVNYALLGYLMGRWAPGKKNPLLFFVVLRNMARGHNAAFKAIHKVKNDAQVGIVRNVVYIEPFSPMPWDVAVAAIARFFQNRWFLNKVKDSLDFIGVNYYFHSRLLFPGIQVNKNKVVSDLGWEVYPEGIYHVVKEIAEYGLPIYITENGLADAKDRLRAESIKEHLKWLHKAIDEGADVKGYFHWSFIDNIEWERGTKPRFGLVEVDYATQKRTPRPSAFMYKNICKTNKVEI